MGRSSSSSTTSQETTNVQDIDTQQVSADGGIGVGASGGGVVNLSLTDAGAVDSAFDFADSFGGRALDTVGKTTVATLDFAGDFGSDAIEANTQVTRDAIAELGSAITRVGDATRSDTTESFRRIALYAAVATAVIFIAIALRKRG